MVALKRRDTAELIAEELRRLDPDDIYAAAVRTPVSRLAEPASVEMAQAAAVEEEVAEQAIPAKKVASPKRSKA